MTLWLAVWQREIKSSQLYFWVEWNSRRGRWSRARSRLEKEVPSNCIQKQNSWVVLKMDAKCNHLLLQKQQGMWISLCCAENIISLCNVIAFAPLGGDTFSVIPTMFLCNANHNLHGLLRRSEFHLHLCLQTASALIGRRLDLAPPQINLTLNLQLKAIMLYICIYICLNRILLCASTVKVVVNFKPVWFCFCFVSSSTNLGIKTEELGGVKQQNPQPTVGKGSIDQYRNNSGLRRETTHFLLLLWQWLLSTILYKWLVN